MLPCVRSYLQRRRNRQGPQFTYEIIVVDDGSRDATVRCARIKAVLRLKQQLLDGEDGVTDYEPPMMPFLGPRRAFLQWEHKLEARACLDGFVLCVSQQNRRTALLKQWRPRLLPNAKQAQNVMSDI